MTFRSVSIAAALLAGAAIIAGCPEDKKGGGENKFGPKPGSTAGTTATSKGAAPTAAVTASGKAAAVEGKGVIKGVIKLAGKAPEMKVPKKRKDADVCKAKEIKYNAVVTDKEGHLQDVLVAIADDQIKADFKASKAAELHQKDCMYTPRIQGILAGQELDIFNDDATMHNVHAYKGTESPLNQAQPAKSAPIKSQKFDEPGIYRMQCDVHPWMRAFVIASDNPFNAVSDEHGAFKIEKVPAGKYTVYAWHSQYGKLEAKDIEVKDGEVTHDFEYTGKELEPKENIGELKDLW